MEQITRFIFELGHLKRIRHEGYRLAGVDDPPSIASHTCRASQIAFILANLEKDPNPEKVACACLFHDLHEARTGDVHKVARRYIEVDKAQVRADQTNALGELGKTILALTAEEHVLVRDADLLEQAVSAKEYLDQGKASAVDWINNVERQLKSDSAKALIKEIRKTDSFSWWQGLKHFG